MRNVHARFEFNAMVVLKIEAFGDVILCQLVHSDFSEKFVPPLQVNRASRGSTWPSRGRN